MGFSWIFRFSWIFYVTKPFEPRLGSFDPETTSPKMDLRPSIDAAGKLWAVESFLGPFGVRLCRNPTNLYQLQQNIDKTRRISYHYYILYSNRYIIHCIFGLFWKSKRALESIIGVSQVHCGPILYLQLLMICLDGWSHFAQDQRFGPVLLRGTWPSQSFQYLGKRNISGVIFGRLELEIRPTCKVYQSVACWATTNLKSQDHSILQPRRAIRLCVKPNNY